MIMYSIFIFTDFVDSVYIKFYAGYFFSALIVIHLYVNICIMIKMNIRFNTRRWFIKKALKRAQAKVIERRYSEKEPDCKKHARRRLQWAEDYERQKELEEYQKQVRFAES